jgi:hypothetical protein
MRRTDKLGLCTAGVANHAAWRVNHIARDRGKPETVSNSPENPYSYQETDCPAVKNLMGALHALRIPAITVASGPVPVKIRKRRACLCMFVSGLSRATAAANREPLRNGRHSVTTLPRMS